MLKRLLTTKIGLLLSLFVFSQSPDAFNYQAVLRDASGVIRANSNVGLRIEILQGSESGSVVYAENFAVLTNSFGMVNLQIGNGVTEIGAFPEINWSAGPYFLSVSVDGDLMGTSQLLSVPYALYAGNGFSGNYNDLTNKPDLSDTSSWNAKSNFSGNYSDLVGKPTIQDTLFNLFSGDSSMQSNTDGIANTAYGYQTLYSNTDGFHNTAVGVIALKSNTTGDRNTAIGSNALTSNSTGNYNTATGVSALSSNLSASFNTATGVSALFKNTTGNSNTANGSFSMYSNSTGYQNTATGDEAMFSNTSYLLFSPSPY